jgi:hypothetical protein
MRKSFVTALVGGLMVASLAAPMAAQSAPKELKLFLRWDDDGAGGCGAQYLSVKDAPDPGDGCAFTFQAAQEVLTVAGLGPLAAEWPGLLKKPVTVSAGQAKGAFTVQAYAAVQTTLELELRATTASGTTTIGNFTSAPLNAAQGRPATVEFALDIPKGLVNKKITGVSLTTAFRGVGAQTHIELDTPAAFITLPAR